MNLLERIKQLGRVWKPIHLCWLFKLLGLPVPPYFIGTTAAVYDQESFRFRNDDGSESAATWYAILNADVSDLDNDTNYRIRINVKEQNTAVGTNENITFQYSKNSGTWTDITTTSSNIKAITSAYFADLDDSTQQLTTGGFDTTNNAMSETGAAGSNSLDPPQDSYVETELCFQVVSADVSNGDTIDIRVLFDGALDTWTQVPRITVLITGATYYQSISGALTFAGAVARVASFFKAFTGGLTFAGNLANASIFLKALSGALTFAGGFSRIPTFVKSLAGVISFSGAVSRAATFYKAFSGGLTFAGSIVKKQFKSIAGGLSFAGAVSSASIFLKSLSGTLTFGAASYPGYDSGTITNPTSALTDFTLMIDLSRMSASWWSANDSSDGTKGRAFKDDGTTELATDWIDFNDTAETGWLRVKWSGTLTSSGTQIIRIFPPLAANSSYSASDTYGSDNAYDSSWEGYYPIYGDSGSTLTDRTSNGEDGTLQTGFTFSADKLTGAAANEGVDLMASKPLDGGSGFTILIESNATDVAGDRGLFYTDNHVGGDPILMWYDNAATDHFGGIITKTGGTTTGALYTNAVPSASTDYHTVLSWESGDEVRFYVGGSEDAAGTFPYDLGTGTLLATAAANYTIGNSPAHTKPFYGTLWNIQIHSAKRADDWISEEYSQTNDNATFWGAWAWTAPTSAINLIKKTSKYFEGGLTFAGGIIKKTLKAFTGGLTFIGNLAATKLGAIYYQSVSGAVTFSGSLIKKTSKFFVGSLSFSGVIIKKMFKAFTGGLTFAGSLIAVKVGVIFYQAVSGAVSFSGSIAKKTSKVFTGSVSFAGSIIKKTVKIFSGGISFIGNLSASRIFSKVLSGSVSFSGIISKKTSKVFTGALSFSGSIIKLTKKIFIGGISFTGSISKKTSKFLSGIIGFIGDSIQTFLGSQITETLYFDIDKTESLDFSIDKTESLDFSIDKTESLDFDITIE